VAVSLSSTSENEDSSSSVGLRPESYMRTLMVYSQLGHSYTEKAITRQSTTSSRYHIIFLFVFAVSSYSYGANVNVNHMLHGVANSGVIRTA